MEDSVPDDEHARELRSTFDDAIIGMATASLDGRFTSVNRALSDIVGHGEAELLGMTFQELTHPDDLADDLANVERMLRGEIDSFVMEKRYIHKRGHPVWVQLSSTLVRDERGAPHHFIAQIQDISERRAAEEQLRKLSRATEQSGEAVIITDRRGVIEYVNRAFTRLTGYAAEEAIGQTPALLKSGAQGAEVYADLWATITAGHEWHGKLIDRRKDGGFYPALMSIAPIFDETGEITHFVANQQDISREQELEEQLRQSQKMEALGTLVGGIAHDFNNLLSAISGNVYLARMDGDETGEALDTIERLSSRAADMIQQLLIFARKDVVELKDFSLTTFLREACQLAKVGIPENIRFRCDVADEPLTIHGDTTQLHQIVMNLVGNARDALAGAENPEIVVEAGRFEATPAFRDAHPDLRGEAFASLSVRDNGPGIPERMREKMFEPFFTTKEVGKGTGLGLSMVFGAVQTHGGAIEVESREGEGTTFRLLFPLAAAEASAGPTRFRAAPGRGELVLLADDEESVRRTTAEVLARLGYRVVEAADGEEALQRFREHDREVALAILDVVMPGMSGYRAAEELRRLREKMPILFVTGYDREELRGEGLDAEHCRTLTKPVPVDRLSRTIRRLLAGRSEE